MGGHMVAARRKARPVAMAWWSCALVVLATMVAACDHTSGGATGSIAPPERTATAKAQQDEERAVRFQQHLDTAIEQRDEGQYGAALAAVMEAISLEPRSDEAWQLQRELVPAATASAQEARTGDPRATATARAVIAEATREALRSDAAWLDPREIAGDTSTHKGKPVMLQGTVLAVNQYLAYTLLLLRAQVPGRGLSEQIAVEVRPKIADVAEDECLRITGTVFGTQRVAFPNRSTTVPLVKAIDWEPGPRGGSATTCSALPADPGNPGNVAERPRGPTTVPLRVITGTGGQTVAIVAVHIGSSGPFSFVLDTGASSSVVSTQVAKELGLATARTIGPVSGVGGVISRAQTTDVTQWRIGNVALPPTELVMIDFPGRSGPDGLLGSDVLSQFGTVNVDFARGVLLLNPS
jgi:hypothetical protein